MTDGDRSRTARNLASEELIRQRAEAYQKVVDEAIAGQLGGEEVYAKLRLVGGSTGEAADYARQYTEWIEAQRTGDDPSGVGPHRELTPEGLDDEQLAAFRDEREAVLAAAAAEEDAARRDAVEAAGWKVLEEKLRRVQPRKTDTQKQKEFQARLAALLGEPVSAPSATFPASVLEAAPHLKELSTRSFDDPHLGSTWRLRQAYEKEIEAVISGMRAQDLTQPIPHTIWKLIIEDRYVSFDKLYATFDPGYDHNDDPKDFGGGYALVKKDQAHAKRPVRTESEWLRVYGAWETAVTLLYPHRVSELSGYRTMVIEIFRAAPQDPSAAIHFDMEARDLYAKNPYRMDDRNRLHLALLAQMFRAGARSGSSGSGSKRGGSQTVGSGPSKRAMVPCNNWNYGTCEDPCAHRRKHGACSECGSHHRARDSPPCFALLQARYGKGSGRGNQEISGGSSGRT
jgi:hypothetical protein